MVLKFKINGLPKDTEFQAMPFGRQLEHFPKIRAFQQSAQSIHLSQKRQSYVKAIREACKLYNVTEYYCQFHSSPAVRDDSFEFWFKSQSPIG